MSLKVLNHFNVLLHLLAKDLGIHSLLGNSSVLLLKPIKQLFQGTVIYVSLSLSQAWKELVKCFETRYWAEDFIKVIGLP